MIVTRVSRAGKTTVLEMLEDMGFYCVDNLLTFLADKFVQLVSEGGDIAQAAFGIDIRSDEELNHLGEILRGWKNTGLGSQVLFLNVNDATLIRRYEETRRSRPLTGTGRLDKGIEKERVRLAFLRKDADFIIDTSKLPTRELRQELERIFLQDREYSNMLVTVLFFGFRYGIPKGTDLVFDVYFSPNPYYMEELRPPIGEGQVIRDYVIQGRTEQAFLDKLYDMVGLLLPNYIGEGKNQLVIAVGCTGSECRSVAMTNALYEHPVVSGEYEVEIEYRDTGRDNKRKQ